MADALLRPTRIYSKVLSGVIKEQSSLIKAMSHITGGGLLENIPRVLPADMAVQLDASKWKMHNIFKWLGAVSDLSLEDFALTFNCGVGMVLICAPDDVAVLLSLLQKQGEFPVIIGEVIPRAELKSGSYDVMGDAVGIAHAAASWR